MHHGRDRIAETPMSWTEEADGITSTKALRIGAGEYLESLDIHEGGCLDGVIQLFQCLAHGVVVFPRLDI